MSALDRHAAQRPAQIDFSRQQRGDRALLKALATPAMYRGAPQVSVHETHASWVFVAGERAYKVKKPLALGFLDYSTLALRRSACREEVRVNQELAPGLYLGVRAIIRSGDGFRIVGDGSPDAVEYLVEMRSFSEQDTFAGLIASGSLTRAHVTAAARLLAAFHRSAEVAADWNPERVLALWRQNMKELQALGPPAGWCLDLAAGFGEAFVAAYAPEFRRRAQLGLVRDGHGDLRCEHVLAGPRVRIVDRIEFDPALRRIDVACDLAFLAMDLEAGGEPWAARELISAYGEAGMDPGGEALRSFYAAHWALVRAKVALIAASEHDGSARAEQRSSAHRLWLLGRAALLAGASARLGRGLRTRCQRQVGAGRRALATLADTGPLLRQRAQAPGAPDAVTTRERGALQRRFHPCDLRAADPRSAAARSGAGKA